MTDFKNLVPTAQFWRAVEIYLQVAYAKTPDIVSRKIDLLKQCTEPELYFSREFESKPPSTETEPQRLALRLGNRFYPHMKLLVQIPSKEATYLFAADTHDQHIRPQPDSNDYSAYCDLMSKNKAIANEIETNWAMHGLPIFKTYLKNKLDQKIAQHHLPAETDK